MPRVNRDLQRRLAARRERERRRPTERRYNFATPEPELIDENGADTDLDRSGLDADTQVATSAPAERVPGSARSAPTGSATSTRGGVHAASRPFSDYKDEYAYVSRDLRRVAAVIGGLLVALIALYFVLPILVH
ncbi:MAG TPA: hypothetical protein VGF29_19410 [Hyphomicrobiaceae bacterium]|jgi:hypothetical protein